jgi:hypothetical protein
MVVEEHQPPAAIDNIAVTPLSCAAPSNVAGVGLTTTTASVSWSAASDATAWRVYYKTSSATAYDSVDVTENPYTLTGLTGATQYNVYVVTSCSDGVSLPSNIATFNTSCYDAAISTFPMDRRI